MTGVQGSGVPDSDRPQRPLKLVVAAALESQDGRILLTRRRDDQEMGGRWELPGGKIEAGESPEQALARELAEELGVEVEVGGALDVVFHRYPGFDLLMLVYRARLGASEPQAIDVAALAWVTLGELATYQLLPADRVLAERLPARLRALSF